MILPVVHNKSNNFTVVRVHYSSDPEKNTPEWVAMAKQGMPELGWNREYELDYTVFEGKPFFPEFKEYNIGQFEYYPRETLYRGWDYGFHRPCCLVTRINPFDQWCWLEAILGEDEGIMEFGKRVQRYCHATYPGAKYVDVGDPAGEQVSDKSEKTSVQILQALGIYVRSRRQPIKQGSEIIRQKLIMRADGKVGLLVHVSQSYVIDGFKGGLHYPETKEGLFKSEFYEKDGYYDHVFDAGRYLATDLFTVIGQQEMPNQLTSDPNRYDYRMGRPEEPQQIVDLSTDLFNDTTDLGGGF
jgi:hypothetical protein